MRASVMLFSVFAAAQAQASVLLLTDRSLVSLDFASLAAGSAVALDFSDGVEMDLAPDGRLFVSRLAGVGTLDPSTGEFGPVAGAALIAQPAAVNSVASGGLDFDAEGRVVVAIHGFPAAGPTRNWYATWDLETETRTGWLNPPNNFRQISFDVLLRPDGTLLSMDYREDRVWSIDRVTGEASILATIDEGVSFLELDEGLFVLTRIGQVWRLDEATGALSLHGQITGLEGNLIGSAVVPAPGAAVLSALLACGVMHRRRR